MWLVPWAFGRLGGGFSLPFDMAAMVSAHRVFGPLWGGAVIACERRGKGKTGPLPWTGGHGRGYLW